MKSFAIQFVSATSLAFLFLASPFTSAAQAQDGPGLVLVLDVAKVFKSYPEFQTQMDAIKQQAESLKGKIQEQQQAIQEQAREVSRMEQGLARDEAEGKVEQQQASLRTSARQAEGKLLTREAQIYYNTYRKMQESVTQLAQENNVALVLRFESESIDPANRGEVIKGVNRQVVYYGSIDLTDSVIERMKTRTASAPRTAPK